MIHGDDWQTGPDRELREEAILTMKELGGEIITTGSDSHNPAQVAYGFKEVYSRLKDMGYKYICTFDKMNANFIKL